VVGCGIMGGGIAQVAAQAGYSVTVVETEESFLEKGLGNIDKFLSKSVAKEKITAEDKDAILGRITGTVEMKELAECDLVIEAVFEDLEVKRELFKTLDGICSEGTVFATNTSSLKVIDIASVTSREGKCVGLHFFNPVPIMPLVEVIKTTNTDEEVFTAVWEVAEKMGKVPVSAQDSTGFIVNLLLIPYIIDGVRALERGVASIGDIDKAMKFGAGQPMGPLSLADLIGLDVVEHIGNIMFDEYKEERYTPVPLLKKLVQEGSMGKKSGKGFYDYSGDKPKPVSL
ncbi:3-hydroxyacyl-CoA dehydrogenase family protein, partial [Planctomycetota bacterium]